MSKYDHLIGMEVASGTWSWDSDRALLYAVGIGAGLDDPQAELHFTTENTPGMPQQVIPTFAAIMGIPGNWMQALGLVTEGGQPVGVVHGEEGVTLLRPITVNGTAHLSKVLTGVYDKGGGALIVMETRITLEGTGEPLGSVEMRLFAHGLGGFGGPRNPLGEQAWEQPDRAPDAVVSFTTGLNQSLIYRLSGDRHPHGTNIERALRDGFERPVLYGLGTYGFACRALLRELCESQSAPFRRMHARFSKPVHPGDRLDTLIWRTDKGALFQTLANGERVVLDRGVFEIA